MDTITPEIAALLAAAEAALNWMTDHAIDLQGEHEERLAIIRLDLHDAILVLKRSVP